MKIADNWSETNIVDRNLIHIANFQKLYNNVDSNIEEFEIKIRSVLKIIRLDQCWKPWTPPPPSPFLVIANLPPPSRKFQISSEKPGQYFLAYFVPILASEHPCDKLETQEYG